LKYYGRLAQLKIKSLIKSSKINKSCRIWIAKKNVNNKTASAPGKVEGKKRKRQNCR